MSTASKPSSADQDPAEEILAELRKLSKEQQELRDEIRAIRRAVFGMKFTRRN